IDVEQSVLNRRVDMRVDQIVKADYTKGIRRCISVPGMERNLREETNIYGDDESKQMILQASISSINRNTHFTAEDFCLQAGIYIEKILKTQRVPIIVGGSNSYIEKLVEDPVFMFKYKYNSCFIWIDVEQSVLNRRVDMRVDQMVKADYTKGIRRSIGVPEMDRYLREETNIDGDDESKQMILQASISSIKRNTRMLICNQLDKIKRLISEKMWSVYHIIATAVFKEDLDEAWTNTVLHSCLDIVKRFPKNNHHNIIIECT
uniref:Isopentenyltransferase n=1 Tax=Solanum lycopersicum TaxID=4081 RepID=A0A3Q7IYJ0_SOLLC